MERVGRTALWCRALPVGSFAMLLGVAGHVMADGLLPGAPTLLTTFAIAVAMGLPVLNRRASRWRVAALLVTGQTAIHLVLSLSAGHADDPVRRLGAGTPSRPGPVALPTVSGRRVGSLQDAYATTGDGGGLGGATLPIGHLVDDLSAHAPMMAAHLVAAALVGLWLAQGERHLWALVDLLSERIVVVLRWCAPVAVPAPTSSGVEAWDTTTGFRSLWLSRPHSRRGPPLLHVA